MLIVLLLSVVTMTFLTTSTLGEVTAESLEGATRVSPLDGMVCQDNVLLVASAATRIACMAICMQNQGCFAFTFTPSADLPELTCHCYGPWPPSNCYMMNVAGSRTYIMDSVVISEQWLERPCASHSDCPTSTVNHVECFADAGQCLCSPGYYYSHTVNNCILDCPVQHLQTTYLKYPNRQTRGHNIDDVCSNHDLDQCRMDCDADARCRTFEVTDGVCCLQPVAALDVPDAHRFSTKYVHYQRTCL